MDMRIDQFVVPGATDDLQEALDLMKQLAAQIKDINGAMKGGEGFLGQARGIAQITQMQEALAAQNAQLVDSFGKLTKAVAIYQERASRRVSTQDSEAKQKMKDLDEWNKFQEKSYRQEEKNRKEAEKREQASINKVRKDSEDAFKQHMAQEKAKLDLLKQKAKMADQAVKENERRNKQELKDAETLRKKQAADAKQLAAEEAKAKKEADDAANSYLQLSKAYAAASLKAKNLQIEMGATHPTAIQATKDAHAMGEELKRLDASVGQYGRNVGNYSGATANLRNSLNQIARELPSLSGGFAIFASAIGNNIAPAADAIKAFRAEQKALAAEGKATTSVWKAIGSAIFSWQTLLLAGVTLLTVYADEIAKATKFLLGMETALTKTQLAQEALNEAFSSSEVKSAVTAYSELNEYVRLAEAGTIKEKDAIDKYNETMGKRVGFETTLAGVKKAMLESGPAYLEFLLAEAEAQALVTKQTELQLKLLVLEKKLQEPLNGFWANLWDAFKAKFGFSDIQQYNDLMKESISVTELLQKARENFQKLAEKGGFHIVPLEEPGKPKKGREPQDLYNETRKAEEARLKAIEETQKIEHETLAEGFKQVAEDESKSFEERLDAYGNYVNERLEAAHYAAQEEIKVYDYQLAEIERIESKNVKDRSKEESSFLLQKKNILAQRALAEKNYLLAVAIIYGDAYQGIDKLNDDHYKDEQAKLKGHLDAMKAFYDKMGQGIAEAAEARNQAEKDNRKAFELSVGAAMELGQVYANFSQKRIQQLEKEGQALQDQLDLEIRNIELSASTEEEKQRRIQEARDETAAKEKILQNERAQELKRQAVFEKALAIAAIITKTAVAIMDMMVKGVLPVDKIALAAATGAMGLAQAAAVATAPVPEYEDGTGDTPHPGGPARLFEGNKAELVLEPGKMPWIGDKEGIYALRPGTDVVSNAELLEATGPYALGLGLGAKRIAEAVGSGNEGGWGKVVQAIENKPVSHFSVTGRGIEEFVEAGNMRLRFEQNIMR